MRRRAAAFLIGGAALGAGAPPVAAAPVEGGSLAWHTVNDFGPAARTWFGYVTNPAPFSGANGTVTPVAPAFGPALSGASPRGAAVRWGMPAVAGGDYDPATRTGTIEFDGGLVYESDAHGFEYALVDPQVVLDGADSKLYASGARLPNTTPFDRSQPVFKLDLSAATFTDTQIKGIAPRIATADWGFPATYPVDAGPDRNPNTFGSFTLTFGATLSATPTTGLDPGGATVTVTGEGFKTGGSGAYLFFGPVGAPFATDTVAPVKYLRPPGAAGNPLDRIESDGSFSTTLTLRPTGGSGAGTFDCAKVACAIRTLAAHTDADPSQRTSVPVTFAPPAPAPGPGPAPAPSPAPAPVTPAKPAAPALSRLSLGRTRLLFRVSMASRVTARIQRRVVRRVRRGGRTRRVVTFRLVRTLRVNAPAAGRYRRKVTLPAGRYRVVVRAVTAAGVKSKRVTQNVRLR